MKMTRQVVCGSAALIACLGSSAQGETFIVSLSGPSFVYDGMTDMDIDLQISIGDVVRWEWESGFHNVVSGFPGDGDEGVLFSSGSATGAPGTFFEHTFTEAGEFGYHCEVHESIGMISSVRVVPVPSSILALAPLGLIGIRRQR